MCLRFKIMEKLSQLIVGNRGKKAKLGEKGSETPEENAKQVSDEGIRNASGLS